MSFYIAKNDVAPADMLMSPKTLMRANPEYYAPRFEAVKELRDLDDGSLHKGGEFRRVASLVNVPAGLCVHNPARSGVAQEQRAVLRLP